MVGEGGPVIASGNHDAAGAEGWFGDFVPEFNASGGEKKNVGEGFEMIAASQNHIVEIMRLGEVTVGFFEEDDLFALGLVVFLKQLGLGRFTGAVLTFDYDVHFRYLS